MTAERDHRKGNAPDAVAPNATPVRASGEDEVLREVAATATAAMPDFRFTHQPARLPGAQPKSDPPRGQRLPDAAIGSAIKDFASAADALTDFDFSGLSVARSASAAPPIPERGAKDAVGVAEPAPLAVTKTLPEIAGASGTAPLLGVDASAPGDEPIAIAPDIELAMARAIAAIEIASTNVAPRLVALTAADLVIKQPAVVHAAARHEDQTARQTSPAERDANDAESTRPIAAEGGRAREGDAVAVTVVPVLASIDLEVAERDPAVAALQPADLILEIRPAAETAQGADEPAIAGPLDEAPAAAADAAEHEHRDDASDLALTVNSPETIVDTASGALPSPSNEVAAVPAIPIYGRSAALLAHDTPAAIPIYGPPPAPDDRLAAAHDLAGDVAPSPASTRDSAVAVAIPTYGPPLHPLHVPDEATQVIGHSHFPDETPDSVPRASSPAAAELPADVAQAIDRTLATAEASDDSFDVEFAQRVAETRALVRETAPPVDAASPAESPAISDHSEALDAVPPPVDIAPNEATREGASTDPAGVAFGAVAPDQPFTLPTGAVPEASALLPPDPSPTPDIIPANEAYPSAPAADASENILGIDDVVARAQTREEPIAASPAEPGPVILRTIGVARHGPGGLDGVDLELRRGEILALVGDYGSGVETMVDILAGDQTSDAGSIVASLDGTGAILTPIASGSRRAALRAGIKAVRRQPALAGSLTGLQNIAIGSGSLLRPRLSRRALRRTLISLQKQYEFRVPLDMRARDMSAGDRMMLDLLAAVHRRSAVIVIDDPLACLTMPEVEQLFRTMRRIVADGFSLVISTRHPEAALAVADRIIVLRVGRVVTDLHTQGENRGSLGAYFAARAVERARPATQSAGRSVLELSAVSARTEGRPVSSIVGVSLDLRSSEIIGIAGKPGNGQEALAAIAWGAVAPSSGVIKLHGRAPRASDPGLFARAGVAKMPLDCRRDALVPSMTVAENLVLDAVHRSHFSRYGVINFAAMRRYAAKVISAYGIACSGPDASIDGLSEVDARKLVFARMISAKPHMIVAHGLTAGCDLATRSEIHRQLLEERDDGAAILLISNDTDELLSLCDQIAVLYRGRLSVLQPAGAFDHHSLNLMMGGEGSMAHDWSGWGGGV